MLKSLKIKFRLWRWKLLMGAGKLPAVLYIGGSDVLPPPLAKEQEETAIRGLSQGDANSKQLLIEHNLRLVVYIAKRFENTGIGLEDLISLGTIGLIKAVNTFNADKNIKLATYASRCIENEILMYLRKTNNQKTEISFDEPLNTDWDGNELLLSDILGTDEDIIYRDIETEVMTKSAVPWRTMLTGRCSGNPSPHCPTGNGPLLNCALAWADIMSTRKRKWRRSWASPKAISAG